MLRRDQFANHPRNARQDLGWGVEGDVGGENDAPIELTLVVSDATLEQLAIGDDDLLTAHATQPGRLQTDALDRALRLIDGDGVTDVERLVENDRKRREEIAENV